MKSLTRKGWAKAIVAVICFLALLSLVAEAACVIFLGATDAYSLTEDSYFDSLYNSVAYSYALVEMARMDRMNELYSFGAAKWVAQRLSATGAALCQFYDTTCCGMKIVRYSPDDPNGVTVTDRTVEGNVIYRFNIEIYSDGTMWLRRSSDGSAEQLPATATSSGADTESTNGLTRVEISVTLVEGIGDMISAGLYAGRMAWEMRYGVYLAAVISLVITVLSWAFLCSGAGRRAGSDEVHLRFPSRIPLDLSAVLLCALTAGMAALAARLPVTDPQLVWPLGTSVCIFGGFIALMIIEWIPVSIAARIKAGKWWENTLIFMILRLIWSIIRGIYRICASVWRKMPYIWRTVIFVFSFALANMIFALCGAYVLLIPLDLALIAAVVWYAASVVRLKNSASRMAAGALGIQTDTKHMPYELKCLGDELGSMGKGLSRALDEKMKSERLKTELITNVSHDIKTPLTSIVNYVELLEREELSGQAAEYVSVLARQSSRMKKLIDDLVEASKASTGNIETHPEPLDLSVMAGQTDGEYAARLAERDLKLVVTGADKPAMVRADSRLVWRIWDNLLGNICKYAMPGTRVYIALERRGRTVATVFRNISEQPLEKSGDELTERFVRGDNSRSGEGSGLGLSIAAGLAAVQGGSLSVTADGDLFKVEVLLPAINEEPAAVPVPTATAEN